MDAVVENNENIYSCIALGGQRINCNIIFDVATVNFDFMISSK